MRTTTINPARPTHDQILGMRARGVAIETIARVHGVKPVVAREWMSEALQHEKDEVPEPDEEATIKSPFCESWRRQQHIVAPEPPPNGKAPVNPNVSLSDWLTRVEYALTKFFDVKAVEWMKNNERQLQAKYRAGLWPWNAVIAVMEKNQSSSSGISTSSSQ